MSLGTKNYYDLLGVPRDAPVQVIRDTYKELARIYHPDSHFFDDILAEAGMANAMPAPTLSPEAETTFKLITEAYNTLNNASKRKEYDALLPRETPDWNADLKADFEADQRARKLERAENATPFTWGSFGAVNPAAGEEPANEQDAIKSSGKARRPRMSDEELAYRSVSQLIKQQNTLAARIKRLFGV